MNSTITAQQPPRPLIYRTAIFAYGVASYAIGVAALLALILVMLGVFQFPGGPWGQLELGKGLALDAALLFAFGLQHSVMARPSFKARWTRVVPEAVERSTYVLAAGLFLFPLLLLWQPMPMVIWSVDTPAWHWSLAALGAIGWAYLFAASFAINHFELFGLQQVFQTLRGRPVSSVPFQERWMYRFDRHPIMSGILIGVWATPRMTLDHLVFAIGATVYICIGVYFEERSLRRQWGQEYRAYCARVGTVVPTFTGRA